MATSYLTDAEKTAYQDVFKNMHKTFARDIYIYKTKQGVFVATNSAYNALYSRLKNSSREIKEVEKYSTTARIKYVGTQPEELVNDFGAQVNVRFPEGTVRLKLDQTGYDLIKTAPRIEIDGELFKIVSDPAKAGPFGVLFYVLYLQRNDQ
tara:strand:+ start:2245 stop:2697 length:453 start_codon:yes stop_codon:yes gene_type:complete